MSKRLMLLSDCPREQAMTRVEAALTECDHANADGSPAWVSVRLPPLWTVRGIPFCRYCGDPYAAS